MPRNYPSADEFAPFTPGELTDAQSPSLQVTAAWISISVLITIFWSCLVVAALSA